MKYLAFLMIFAFMNSAVADVVYVKKGDPAPFEGYLFDPAKEKETRLKLIEFDFCLKEKESQANLINFQKQELDFSNQRIELYKTQVDNLAKQTVEQRDSSAFKEIGAFVLGAVLTGLVAYGVSHTIR